jgi:ribosome-associated protein
VQILIIFARFYKINNYSKNMDKKVLKVIADAMLEKKAQDVVSLDLKPIGTAISDYFIVCNADSTPAVAAIADNIEDRMIEKCKRKVIRTQGKENAFWVIMDYGDIVVHIFQTPYRAFYRLEDLWADAPREVYSDED